MAVRRRRCPPSAPVFQSFWGSSKTLHLDCLPALPRREIKVAQEPFHMLDAEMFPTHRLVKRETMKGEAGGDSLVNYHLVRVERSHDSPQRRGLPTHPGCWTYYSRMWLPLASAGPSAWLDPIPGASQQTSVRIRCCRLWSLDRSHVQ